MLPEGTRAVLLDIEGTTSSISFVHDVLFPYARKAAPAYLEANWSNPAVVEAGRLMIEEAGLAPAPPTLDNALAAMNALMDRDAKVTGLKRIQGWIWKIGYDSGELKTHVYPDLVPALNSWRNRGLRIFIYSSGSIEAQKLFFGHTIAGALLPFFEGHFDTTTGPKVEASSYAAIAKTTGFEPGEVCFFSDAIKEIQAAHAAGMKVRLTVRPGNAPVPAHPFETVTSLPVAE